MGKIGEELKALLRYVDGFAPESGYTRELDSAVAGVRSDEKWKVEYMRFNELMMDTKRLGEYTDRIKMIREFRTQFDEASLIKISYHNPELLHTILDAIDANPDWDDEQVAEYIFL